MKSDILVIGGGASGMMAAYSAGKSAADGGRSISVTVLEKMPRPGRKIMITGKGRCNFTNVKDWNEFSGHIRAGAKAVKPAFHALPPERVIGFFESFGMKTVVERGDRAFPESHRSSDVVDTLVNACHGVGVKFEYGTEAASIGKTPEGYIVTASDSRKFQCTRIIIATGGLSYPSTGCTGDGYRWAQENGHRIMPTFPSLTALVPRGYKIPDGKSLHIDRSTPLSDSGGKLCGVMLKNVLLTLEIQGSETDSEFGDVDFTDGGIEGPIGFSLSRKAVKAMTNGSKVALVLDLKPGISIGEIGVRVRELLKEIEGDPRSRRLREKERCRILLGKLMPRDLIPAFAESHPGILETVRRGRTDARVFIKPDVIAAALKHWRFDIAGYVGYERAVITAGGVSTDDIIAKTMESRFSPGMYFCGEVLDADADTGGYNLQIAFCTGALAGKAAASTL